MYGEVCSVDRHALWRPSETLLGEAYQRRFLRSTSVWMERYAGTRWRADTQDLNRMVLALTRGGRVVSAEP